MEIIILYISTKIVKNDLMYSGFDFFFFFLQTY